MAARKKELANSSNCGAEDGEEAEDAETLRTHHLKSEFKDRRCGEVWKTKNNQID